MPQTHKLCFLVADGEHARFLRPAEDNALHAFETMNSATAHLRTSDLVSDRSGRSFESDSVTRHAHTPRHDPHDEAKKKFAHIVAARANALSAADAFHELVLVAPSHILSEIADALDQPAAARVTGRLAKDLTKVPEHDLPPHLKEWLRPVHRAE